MKTLFILSSILFSNTLLAKCNTRAIGVIHETGFGISFGGGGSSSGSFDKNVTNVPLTINGELACFKKTSKFDIKAEAKKDGDQKNKMVITPMKLEYENIPNPHFRQYIFIENNENPLLRKIHQMSFVCSGEIPLSIEATSDNVLKVLADNSSASVNVSHVFATGAAADNLKRANFKYTTQPTFDFFGKLYKDKSLKEVPANDCCNDMRIPSILNSTSINSLAGVERSIASNFTTMGAEVPNGCSSDFIKSMNNYLLENYKENESLRPYKISEKWFSSDLVFEW